ncbi:MULTISPECIES: hypothetical protein [Bacillota]|uniref:hypothetical protein n=1 Tax=Bacillota TaxID=1239 RepID=UPI0039F04107
MKVKDLIKHLQSLKPEAEVFVAVRKGYRPIADLKPVKELEIAFEQDSKELRYFIDVDVEPMYRIPGIYEPYKEK